MSVELEETFPGLATDGYVVASPKTHAYNCVAWAAEDASRWWEPGIYWPGPLGDDLAALAGLFAALAYAPCEGDELEAGHAKVALCADDQGEWTHAARQLPDGWWTSKLGPDFAGHPSGFVRSRGVQRNRGQMSPRHRPPAKIR